MQQGFEGGLIVCRKHFQKNLPSSVAAIYLGSEKSCFALLGSHRTADICRFPEIRGHIWGVPVIRSVVYEDLYWGPLLTESVQNLGPIAVLCRTMHRYLLACKGPASAILTNKPRVYVSFSIRSTNSHLKKAPWF